jgi:DNA-binding response OmpR family regulator
LIEARDLGGILQLALGEYDVELHGSDAAARDAFRRRAFDLAIVDLSLGMQQAGLELIGEWRKSSEGIPIIVLSDLPQPNLPVVALDAGADDFLRKPFHHAELVSRIRKQLLRQRWREAVSPVRAAGPAPLRRAGGVFLNHEAFAFGPATVTPDLLIHFPDGAGERLLPKQMGILRFFADRAGGLVLKDDLLKAVWGSDAGAAGHSVNEYISILRRLFRQHQVDFNALVASEPKVGWRIAPAAAASAAS